MITPSHLIYGWALAKGTERAPNVRRTRAFVLGSFLPDVPVYAFFLIHGIILGTSQRLMWDELYFDSAWTPVFTLSHSLLLWPAVLALGLATKQTFIRYVGTAGLLHVCLDFLVHNDDAYRHFWPLTDWKFISPISYWDSEHYGRLVGGFDTLLVIGLLGWLWTKYPGRYARGGIIVTMLLYVASVIIPYVIF